MRKEVAIIIDTRGALHFCSDINGIPREADLWFTLEESKTLFVNVEQIMTRLKEAHNVTSVTKVTDMDYRVVYNAFVSEEGAQND